MGGGDELAHPSYSWAGGTRTPHRSCAAGPLVPLSKPQRARPRCLPGLRPAGGSGLLGLPGRHLQAVRCADGLALPPHLRVLPGWRGRMTPAVRDAGPKVLPRKCYSPSPPPAVGCRRPRTRRAGSAPVAGVGLFHLRLSPTGSAVLSHPAALPSAAQPDQLVAPDRPVWGGGGGDQVRGGWGAAVSRPDQDLIFSVIIEMRSFQVLVSRRAAGVWHAC